MTTELLMLVLSVVSPWLMLTCLCAVPPVLLASVRFARLSAAAYLGVRDRIAGNLARLQEGITGVRVIQAFGREDEQIEAFRGSNQALFRARLIATLQMLRRCPAGRARECPGRCRRRR